MKICPSSRYSTFPSQFTYIFLLIAKLEKVGCILRMVTVVGVRRLDCYLAFCSVYLKNLMAIHLLQAFEYGLVPGLTMSALEQ